MAIETPDRMHAAVSIVQDDVTGALVSVRSHGMVEAEIVRTGPGIILVVLVDGMAAGEWHASLNVVRFNLGPIPTPATYFVIQVSDTEFEIRTFDNTGVAADADRLSCVFFKTSQGVGT